MIDTKELRDAITRCPSTCGTGNLVLKAADEIDRMRLDNAPLSREEMETVLKEAGWVITDSIGKQVEWQLPTKDEDEMASVAIFWNDGGFSLEMSGKCAPSLRLSKVEHVCRRLLRDCGVIALDPQTAERQER